MREIWGTFAQKVSEPFSQAIFSDDSIAFLAYNFEVTTKNKCMRFTNCWCWEMCENVAEGEKVWESLGKQTI